MQMVYSSLTICLSKVCIRPSVEATSARDFFICDHTVLRILMILGVGVLYGKSSSVILKDPPNVTRTLLKGVNEFISVLSLLDTCGSIRYRKSLCLRENL